MPLENESVEAVLSVFTLHKLPEEKRKTVVKEIYRVLKKKGCFLLVEFVRPDTILEKILFLFLRTLETSEALKFAYRGFEEVEQNCPFR